MLLIAVSGGERAKITVSVRSLAMSPLMSETEAQMTM